MPDKRSHLVPSTYPACLRRLRSRGFQCHAFLFPQAGFIGCDKLHGVGATA